MITESLNPIKEDQYEDQSKFLYSGWVTEYINSRFVENDYLGMAQDLRRMKRRFRESEFSTNLNLFLSFYDSLTEFEDYCLDQPVRIIDDLIKNSAKMMLACEV